MPDTVQRNSTVQRSTVAQVLRTPAHHHERSHLGVTWIHTPEIPVCMHYHFQIGPIRADAILSGQSCMHDMHPIVSDTERGICMYVRLELPKLLSFGFLARIALGCRSFAAGQRDEVHVVGGEYICRTVAPSTFHRYLGILRSAKQDHEDAISAKHPARHECVVLPSPPVYSKFTRHEYRQYLFLPHPKNQSSAKIYKGKSTQ